MQLIRGSKKVATYVDIYKRDRWGNGTLRHRQVIPYRIAHFLHLTARKQVLVQDQIILSQMVSNETQFQFTPWDHQGMRLDFVHREQSPVQVIVKGWAYKEVGFE